MRYTPDPRRFPSRFDKDYPFQPAMRAAFIDSAQSVCNRDNFIRRSSGVYQIGIEAEYSLVTTDLKPAPQSVRDAAITACDQVTAEVGASQIEITTDPCDIRTVSAMKLYEEFVARELNLAQWLGQHGSHLLRIGANPLVRIADIVCTQGVTKYQLCPQFHNDNQRPGLNSFIGLHEPIDVRSASIPSLTNSIQVNIDCDPENAIAIQNRSLEVAPLVTLLSPNAGMIDGRDTSLADMRCIAWAISHDIRSWSEFCSHRSFRVGLPFHYYEDLSDYLNSVLEHPFFMEDLPAAFPMAIGTYWRDARIKFLDKPEGTQLVVEFRPISTQPSAEYDFCLMFFYIGLVMQAEAENTPLLPMDIVYENKELAMRLGRAARLSIRNAAGTIVRQPAKQVLADAITRSLAGLVSLEVDQETIDFTRDGLQRMLQSPAPIDQFRTHVQDECGKGATMQQALHSAIHHFKLFS